jgi:hypothetical protein
VAFVAAYNVAKHLKALRWRTSFEAITESWTKDASTFKINPHHLIPGPYTYTVAEIDYQSLTSLRLMNRPIGSAFAGSKPYA